MKFFNLIWSNLKRKKLRTILTVLSIMVAFVLFAYLAAIRVAFSMGIDVVGLDRLVVRHKVSIMQMLPESYEARMERIKGVDDATFATWFGGVYQKPSNFFMNIKTITHLERPWVVNSFAGITKLTMAIPQAVANNFSYRKSIPNLVEFYRPNETTGVAIASIKKNLPGQGMATGQHIAAADLFAKVIIIVDEDIDVHDKTAIFHAIGTRWQPDPATLIIPQTRGMPLDPSSPRRWLTSKAVVDATRQWPSEGGPDSWPDVSRQILEEQSPETFDLVDGRWEEYLKEWRRRL